MDLNLKGKIALVTGGSHGIGLSICKSLAQEGCEIILCASGKRYDMNKAYNEIREYNASCLPLKKNINNKDDVDDVLNKTYTLYGKIDILVNNIGGGSSWGNTDEWHTTSELTWEEVLRHNLNTTLWFTNGVLQNMIENKFGRIISISSIYGKENGGMPWFQSAKSAQISLMKSYSSNIKYSSKNITFNTICPGFINMKDKQQPKELETSIPAQRFGIPDDIAPMVAFLCSDNASYINGTTIAIDGGFTKSF